MTAVILAAGVGKRLLAEAGGRPKCLIEIGGKTLLVRLLEGLAAAGVGAAVIVVGFGEEVVRGAVGEGPPGIRVRYVRNPRYREGAILSLWAVREVLEGPVLIMDADVLCTAHMIERLVRSRQPNCFLMDASVPPGGEEQMLITDGDRVRTIVRGGVEGDAVQGESVGFLKLSVDAAKLLADLLGRRVAAGETAIEHEEVYPELLAGVEVGYERIDGLPWIEIDFPEDVARAERDILPRLAAT